MRACCACRLIGDLVTKVDVARFARTLATLLGNGVTLLSGLSIVKETVGNGVLAGALDGVIVRLREGKGFGRPLARDRRLSATRGADDSWWARSPAGSRKCWCASPTSTTAKCRWRSSASSPILEPALILSLAVFVGGIVFSILLGVMGMSELVQ